LMSNAFFDMVSMDLVNLIIKLFFALLSKFFKYPKFYSIWLNFPFSTFLCKTQIYSTIFFYIIYNSTGQVTRRCSGQVPSQSPGQVPRHSPGQASRPASGFQNFRHKKRANL
jgi:hypothetical protein